LLCVVNSLALNIQSSLSRLRKLFFNAGGKDEHYNENDGCARFNSLGQSI